MTAAAKDVKSDKYGIKPIPDLYDLPLAATTKIYAGTMVATDSSGNAVPASATGSLKLWGRAESQVDNTSGGAGALRINVAAGVFFFNNGSGADAIANSNRGAYVYASDDNVVTVGDAGGTRPLAGYVVDVPASGTIEFGKVAVAVGMARPDAFNPEIQTQNTARKARVVATSIGAYTAALGVISVTATGALAAQDSITLVATDVVMIPEGLTNVTAADAGPYTVTTAGNTAAGPTFTRPDWWPHGAAIVPGEVISIGGEGTIYPGTAWKTFVAKSKIVGTDAPLFYPDFVCQAATLTGGITPAITNVPIRGSTGKTFFGINRLTTGGTITTSVQYVPTSITAGVLGTATFTVTAQTSTGATDTADTSILIVGVHNW